MIETLDSKDVIIVNFDGLCEPKNPGGIATYGFVIYRSGRKIHQEYGIAYARPWSDEASNNVAEYSAVIHALEWLKGHDYLESPIILRGDSRLVVNQISGIFKVKATRIVELYERTMKILAQFSKIKVEWVERSLNKEADLLSRIAYSKFVKSKKSTNRSS